MAQKFENNSSSTLLSGIGTTDTQVTLQPGDGALFPPLGTAGDFFVATLEDVSGNTEIVTCTARSGDTVTIVRGAEATSAQTFAADSRFELRVTKQTLENFAQLSGSTFTGLNSLPGFDLITSDFSVHSPFEYRYSEVLGIPTVTITGPATEPSAWTNRTYKSAGEYYEWGIQVNGMQVGTGYTREAWYGQESGDPDQYIERKITKPATDEMQYSFRPSSGSLSVSYLFEVIDSAGVSREIVLNADGSIAAEGDFSFGSLTLPLADDATLEILRGEFRDYAQLFSTPQRIFVFEPENISGDVGAAGSGVGYTFVTRKEDGTLGFMSITPNGDVWGTGEAVFTKVTISDQGEPTNVAPNELVTKATVSQLIESPTGAGTGYFSEVLYTSVAGVTAGTYALAHPIITSGGSPITHYQQVIVEALADTGDYTTILLDSSTLRLNTNYVLGSPYVGDASGGAGLRFPDYSNFVALSPNGGRITRIIGVSYQGDPFPA